MSDNERLELFERNKDIQEMINTFLSDNHMPTITEMTSKEVERGVLTPTHKLVLQQMVKKHFPNIDELIRKNHQGFADKGQVLGVLTGEEIRLIYCMLEDYRLIRCSKEKVRVH